jgi:16S rRNA processing protein RimM
MARPSYDPDSLLVGVLGRPHGLSGELTLRPYNHRGARLAGVRALILERDDAREQRQVTSARPGGDGWLVRLVGIDSRDAAASLTHALVRVRRDALPALEPGEFFVEDIIGCTVRTDQGRVLGIVDSVFWNGAQDIMVVKGEAEELVPLVPEFLRGVDTGAREVLVAWEPQNE